MGYRDWDETAAVDRVSDWLLRNWAVRVVLVSAVALLAFGVDVASPPAALRTWFMVAVLVAAATIALVQFVRARRRWRMHPRPDRAE
jgi:membrane protein YdbS with pleckstrin-like domain